jgi:hypothetical protein
MVLYLSIMPSDRGELFVEIDILSTEGKKNIKSKIKRKRNTWILSLGLF